MMKVNVAHYKNLKGTFYINGGKLLVYDNEVVLKGFIKKVAEISDDNNSFECLFFKKDFEKLREI